MRKFKEGDRVVFIHDSELIPGTIKGDYTGLDMYLVETDTAVCKVSANLLAPEPVQAVTETQDNTEVNTILLASLSIIDRIVSNVCPVGLPYDEVENEF